MIAWLFKKIFGTKNEREIKRLWPIVQKINEIEATYQQLSEAEFLQNTEKFKARLSQGETLNDILPEAFATVKNACRRLTQSRRVVNVRGQDIVWEMIPYDVQLLGGIVLHQGKISEMATGEGKTLVATAPVYLNALAGKGVHVVTVNDYLAARDSEWMGELYRYLGLTVGCIQHDQPPHIRRQQYACDITYGTNSEFGFDYLRDNGMALRKEDKVQRGHSFAIVDEVDSILIDEARTPLIISGPVTVSTHQFDKYKPGVAALVREQAKEVAILNEKIKNLIEAKAPPLEYGRLMFKVKLAMPRSKPLLKLIEDPVHRRAMDDAELSFYQDTRRVELFKLKDELLFSIDERNHEADLSERGRQFLSPNNPEAFTLPDLLTRFHEIDQMPISPEAKDQEKQKIQKMYDETNERIHHVAQLLRAYCLFEKDVHYVVQDNKVIIVDEYTGRLMPGRRWSDGLHQAVEAKEGVEIDRETQTLATITIQNYFRLYDKLSGMTGTAETEANEFHDIYKLDVVVIPTHKPCIRIDKNDAIFKTRRAKYNATIEEIKKAHQKGQPVLVGTVSVDSSEVISRMLKREGIPHAVLNAKYHQQEAEIVARAGQKGAVTIATNMAGRGTDIKLGPGVAELGGLYVIGTERHEARRIDRQLRGRCSRQGDPGMSRFYISFEDDLMRNFGDSRRISTLMTRLGMSDEEELEHPWLNRAVETAQKRVEQRNYMIRKHTLQYDDVMNMQRTVVYGYRDEVLETENPRELVFEVIQEVVQNQAQSRLTATHHDLEGLIHWVNSTFPLGLSIKDLDAAQPAEKIAEQIIDKIKSAYALKVKFEQPEAIASLERMMILSAIDRLWQEHLYAMDGLRQSINLRAYAQKDPLIEYKNEAYSMFEDLMARIKNEIVHNVFRSATSLEAFERFFSSLPQRLIHEQPPAMAGSNLSSSSEPGASSNESARASEDQSLKPIATIRRTGPKLGRNDPCPLDPKKKFKNCCGALGEKTCIKA